MKKKQLIILLVIIVIITITTISINNSYSNKTEENNIYLYETIINNNSIITDNSEEIGLHKYDSTYYYKGNVINNYIKINNELWRIIEINNENDIKIIKDKSIKKDKVSEIYNLTNYENTKINTILNEYYKNELSNIKQIIKKEKYCIEYKEKCIKEDINYISLLDEESAKNIEFPNNENEFWIISNTFYDQEIDQSFYGYINEDGNIDQAFVDEEKDIKPVITIFKVLYESGDGTEKNPYTIKVA